MFTCGFVRSNRSFAISALAPDDVDPCGSSFLDLRRPSPGRRCHAPLANLTGEGVRWWTGSLPAPGLVTPTFTYRGRVRRTNTPAPAHRSPPDSSAWRPTDPPGVRAALRRSLRAQRGRRLEPMTGLEPVTSSLPRTRSTTELHRLVPARCGTGTTAEGRFAGRRRPYRPVVRMLERETGIEPATNSLEGCDSTTELLPLPVGIRPRALPRHARAPLRRPGTPTRPHLKPAAHTASPVGPGALGRRVVARGGFEPPKPLGRQIYSLLRLTAPQPRRSRTARRPATAPAGSRQKCSLGFLGLGNRVSRTSAPTSPSTFRRFGRSAS